MTEPTAPIVPMDDVVPTSVLLTTPPSYEDGAGATTTGRVRLLTALMPHQVYALEWMKTCEQKQGGGILADDMGLGKTMDSIALMMSDITDAPGASSSHHHEQPQQWPSTPNLILCPKSLLGQWRDEIMAHTNVPFERILIYHGKRRQTKRRHHQQWLRQRHDKQQQEQSSSSSSSVQEVPVVAAPAEPATAALFFVVLMTYDTLRAEHKQHFHRKRSASTRSFVFDTHWRRIILDEAHLVRAQNTQVSHAVMALQAERRWCVTGTPYNNSVSDVASLCAFLRIAPYHSMHWWNKHNEDEKAIAQWREQCLLRRTKSILDLPPVEHVIIDCPLDARERAFYDYIFQLAVRKYAQFQSSLQRNKLQMFGTMLSYLLRLRQACDHPLVVLGRVYTRVLSRLSLSSTAAIENTVADQSCVGCACSADTNGGALCELDCGHRLCAPCFRDMTAQLQKSSSSAASVAAVVECDSHDDDGDDVDSTTTPSTSVCALCDQATHWKQALIQPPAPSPAVPLLFGGSVPQKPSVARFPSTKIQQMIECVADARRRNAQSKTVIFSQWTTAMDVIENALISEGYGVVRYDGDVSNIDKRNHYVRMFKDDPSKQIFLGSLQAGGLGLNLAVADTVIIFDSWYNPFAEDQAVDRVHRMGQKRPVRVIRLRCPGTVEDDVLRIQHRKRMAAETLFSEKRWASTAITLESTAITEDDVHSIFRANAGNGQVCRFHASVSLAAAASIVTQTKEDGAVAAVLDNGSTAAAAASSVPAGGVSSASAHWSLWDNDDDTDTRSNDAPTLFLHYTGSKKNPPSDSPPKPNKKKRTTTGLPLPHKSKVIHKQPLSRSDNDADFTPAREKDQSGAPNTNKKKKKRSHAAITKNVQEDTHVKTPTQLPNAEATTKKRKKKRQKTTPTEEEDPALVFVR